MATVAELASSLGKSNKVVLDKLAEMGVFAPGPGYELTGTERSKVREALDVVIDPKKRKKDDGTPAHSNSTGPGAGEGGKQPSDGGDDGDAEDDAGAGNGTGEEGEGAGDGDAEAQGQSESEEEGDGEGEESGEGEGEESEGNESDASDEFEDAEADSEAEQEQEQESDPEPPTLELAENATYGDMAVALNISYAKLEYVAAHELVVDIVYFERANDNNRDTFYALANVFGYEYIDMPQNWGDTAVGTIGRVLSTGEIQLDNNQYLRVGDAIAAGNAYCRVQTIHEADGLAYNVVLGGTYTVTGWVGDPQTGYRVALLPNDKEARRYARS